MIFKKLFRYNILIINPVSDQRRQFYGTLRKNYDVNNNCKPNVSAKYQDEN